MYLVLLLLVAYEHFSFSTENLGYLSEPSLLSDLEFSPLSSQHQEPLRPLASCLTFLCCFCWVSWSLILCSWVWNWQAPAGGLVAILHVYFPEVFICLGLSPSNPSLNSTFCLLNWVRFCSLGRRSHPMLLAVPSQGQNGCAHCSVLLLFYSVYSCVLEML